MRHLWKIALFLILVPFLMSHSCAPGDSYVVLNFETDPALLQPVVRIDIDVKLSERTSHTTLEPGGEIAFPTAVTLDLGTGAGPLAIKASAKNQAGKEVAHGSGAVEVEAGKTTSLTILLAPATQLEITPTSKDLGLVAPGDVSEAAFQVRNSGEILTGGLTVTLTGEEFVLVSNGCAGALPAGWSCTVKVALRPTTAGNKAAKLMVSGNPGGTVEAALTGTGNWYLWSKRLGGTLDDSANAVAVDGGGNVLVAGSFRLQAEFGGETLTSAGGSEVFVAKYAPDGRHLWSKRLGGTSSDYAWAVAVDGSSNVLVAGDFAGTADFGGGPLTSVGYDDIFLAKYDANGTHLWSKRLGGTGSDAAWSMAVDGSGNVLVTGAFEGTADFGGGPLVSAGNTDIFVAKYSSGGTHLWSKRFGGTDYERAWAVAADGSGNVLLAGDFAGMADLGGGPLTSAGSDDVFVARYDASGVHLWSKRFGGAGNERASAMAVDRSGSVLLAGEFLGTADFGGGPLTSAGSADIFVAKYDAGGAPLWSKRFGGSGYDRAWAVAADGSSGHVLMAGQHEGGVDFGGGVLSSHGFGDIFAVQCDAGGAHLWSRSFGGTFPDSAATVAVDGSGNMLVAGDFASSVDFGGGAFFSTGRNDGFLLKLAPQRTVTP